MTFTLRGRVEIAVLWVDRFGLRGRDIAELLRKNPASVSRRLELGARRERDDPDFRDRLNALDRLLSAPDANNVTM